MPLTNLYAYAPEARQRHGAPCPSFAPAAPTASPEIDLRRTLPTPREGLVTGADPNAFLTPATGASNPGAAAQSILGQGELQGLLSNLTSQGMSQTSAVNSLLQALMALGT